MNTWTDRTRTRAAGFTLIELVVAIGIFAVMAVMAYGGLRTVLATGDHLEQAARRLAGLETAFAILQQDLEQAVARGVRDELGDPLPAMRGGLDGVLLELTRGGVGPPPDGAAAVDLRRIGYSRDQDRLVRHVWPVLDRAQSSETDARLLASDIAGVEIDFYDRDWMGFWPPAGNRNGKAALPAGVRIELTFTDGASASRVFLVRTRG